MRISGGRLKGRQVAVPPGEIRPSMDRMRESVFGFLGPIDGLSFADLFSGSGIIGLEAASRGASPVVLVEADRRKARTLRENALIASPARIGIRVLPVERFVVSTRLGFDLVFLDPPFPYRFKTDLLEKAAESGIVAPGGRLLIHFPAEDELPDRVGDLGRTDERRYGRSTVRVYTRARPLL